MYQATTYTLLNSEECALSEKKEEEENRRPIGQGRGKADKVEGTGQ